MRMDNQAIEITLYAPQCYQGAKPHRRCGRLDAISLLSPG
jgi:hypothetical protein